MLSNGRTSRQPLSSWDLVIDFAAHSGKFFITLISARSDGKVPPNINLVASEAN